MSRKKLTKDDILKDDKLTPQEKHDKYMKTQEWKDIRLQILERDGWRCRCCGRTNDDPKAQLTIHHSTYDNLFNEEEHLDDLITLCKYCHYQIHQSNANKYRFKKK